MLMWLLAAAIFGCIGGVLLIAFLVAHLVDRASRIDLTTRR